VEAFGVVAVPGALVDATGEVATGEVGVVAGEVTEVAGLDGEETVLPPAEVEPVEAVKQAVLELAWIENAAD
jgi:hypothetical protein